VKRNEQRLIERDNLFKCFVQRLSDEKLMNEMLWKLFVYIIEGSISFINE